MTENTQDRPEFSIHTVTLAATSLQLDIPAHKLEGQWAPDASVDLNIQHEDLGDNNYEVKLSIVIVAKNESKPVFTTMATRSGVFSLRGFPEEQLEEVLHVSGPIVLFPYVRQDISDLIQKAGYPPLYLKPVDFLGMYRQRQSQAETQTDAAESEASTED